MNWSLISWEWAVGILLAFPLLLLVANELLTRAARSGSALAPTLGSFRNLLLPAAGLAAMTHFVFQGSLGAFVDRLALTVLWTAVLFVALQFVNDVVFGAAAAGTWRANVPSLFRDIVRSLLVGVGAAVVYSEIWDYSLAGALTALGVGSLVIGLALQEPLGNVFSGVMLLFERPVALGDWVEVDGKKGRVVEMNWRAVNMETQTHETIIVPNSSLYKTSFANLSRPTAVRTTVVELGFSYNDAPNRVKQVLGELAHDTPGVLRDPAPVVRTVKYADFTINYEVYLSVARQGEVPAVRDEFMTRVWYAVQRSGLTIPFPIATEIEAEPKDFERPALEPQTVLAQHPRFADSLHVPTQMQTLFYSKGETLLKQGDEQDGLALVLEGKAVFQVTAADGSVSDVGLVNTGDFYGEHSILAGTASRAALVALTDMRVAHFDLESSRKLVEASPRLAREVGETIDRRRADVQASLRRGAGQ